jgi:hypothetical protein
LLAGSGGVAGKKLAAWLELARGMDKTAAFVFVCPAWNTWVAEQINLATWLAKGWLRC